MSKIDLRVYLDASNMSVPTIGNVSQADSIVVAAFGRNTFEDNEMSHIYDTYQLNDRNDVSTTEDLRENWEFKTGLPNRRLAQYVQQLADANKKLRIYAQWEILCGFDHDWLRLNAARVFGIWPGEVKSFDAQSFLNKVNILMIRHGKKRPIAACHAGMANRFIPMIEKIGFDPISTGVKIEFYDRNSVQPWTTTRNTWLDREQLVRYHHKAVGRT